MHIARVWGMRRETKTFVKLRLLKVLYIHGSSDV